MTIRSMIKRAATVGGATTALVLAGSMSASAHDCIIPMYSLNAPSTANWFSVSAEMGAAEFAGFTTECDAQREAGYAALDEAGLPVGIRIFDKMTIGQGNNNIVHDEYTEENPFTGSGQGQANNKNGANGKGLEYFSAGSGLPFDMIGTYVGGASSVTC